MMMKYALLALIGISATFCPAKARDGRGAETPQVGLAIVKNAVPGSYTATICFYESDEWELDYFETATFVNPHRQSLSETFGNGSGDRSNQYLVVTFSDKLSDVGGLDIYLHLRGDNSDAYLGFVVRLTELFWSEKLEEYVVTDYPVTENGWCSVTKKMDRAHVSVQRREKID